jgi:hypothetical protein
MSCSGRDILPLKKINPETVAHLISSAWYSLVRTIASKIVATMEIKSSIDYGAILVTHMHMNLQWQNTEANNKHQSLHKMAAHMKYLTFHSSSAGIWIQKILRMYHHEMVGLVRWDARPLDCRHLIRHSEGVEARSLNGWQASMHRSLGGRTAAAGKFLRHPSVSEQ